MDKHKKAWLIMSIFVVFVVGFFVGKNSESRKYRVPLAGCQTSILPTDKKYLTIKLEFPTKKMFQNYYSPSLDFTELYLPETDSVKTTFETFGYNGYFKVSTGEIYQCGFFK
ncbi:MAG: hypothetical protein UT48_C0039G0007 [Parcubacteria group bacterium GW2011_GWE2_39_37]|uniref:Uncharacterized protein n=1 Tax=Candidatus Falkowbacteria bacterium GW2011_GWF2_39_8 TaxID=1618642 RepID=A0A0G0Q461_9BACT|nr:MAG: hypothetical protein UT48_C0039G0007 [Parcubacteria group bacterium GW2011_GWE2_39_37]KKR32146.1 MAG: hypothetical protein UT64_C0041G0010 [Candidatus Falkowbacteria bacterium GW2011_GWF2_39_8]